MEDDFEEDFSKTPSLIDPKLGVKFYEWLPDPSTSFLVYTCEEYPPFICKLQSATTEKTISLNELIDQMRKTKSTLECVQSQICPVRFLSIQELKEFGNVPEESLEAFTKILSSTEKEQNDLLAEIKKGFSYL